MSPLDSALNTYFLYSPHELAYMTTVQQIDLKDKTKLKVKEVIIALLQERLYTPGNPLIGQLAPRSKQSIDADNELLAELRQIVEGL